MPGTNLLLETATFTPRIKGYIFWMGVITLFFTLIGIPFLVFWILGLGQYIGRRYYESLVCELTEKHLRFKKGVMFKVEKTIPLENIQDLTFLDNPFLRLFDLRILKIETAGHSQQAGSDMKLIGITDTYDFKEKVLTQRDHNPAASAWEQGDEARQLLKEIKAVLIEIRDRNSEKEA